MPTALRNIHNSCYINAILQCLVYFPELTQWCKDHATTHEMIKEYSDLQVMLTSSYKEVAPHRFLHYVYKWFKMVPGEQHDAHEFLTHMLDVLNCPATQGIRRSILGTSVQTEPFTCLELPIPRDGATLEECISAGIATEMVEYEGKQVEKRWEIQCPPILCIVFLRFHATSTKKNWRVLIPKKLGQYTLMSVCNHHGSATNGHYTAYVYLDEWYECNDESIRKIEPTMENAYCIFFRKTP
jgi:ubiquitin C-terminal hydrolase